MPGPAAAACLPLMREVDSPQAKTEGEKRVSPPVFCFAKASPLVRGGLCIPPAVPVLMIESEDDGMGRLPGFPIPSPGEKVDSKLPVLGQF